MARYHDRSDDESHHQGNPDVAHQRQQREGQQHRGSDRRHENQEVTHDPNRQGHQPYAPRSSHESVQPGQRQVGQPPGQQPGQPPGQQGQEQRQDARRERGHGRDYREVGGHPGSAGRHQEQDRTDLQRGAEQQHRRPQPSHHGPSPQQSHGHENSRQRGTRRQRRGHQQPSHETVGRQRGERQGPQHVSVNQGGQGGQRGQRGRRDQPRSRQQAYDPHGRDRSGDYHYTDTSGGGDRRNRTDQGNVPQGNERRHDQHPEHLMEEGLTHDPPSELRREGDRRNQYGP